MLTVDNGLAFLLDPGWSERDGVDTFGRWAAADRTLYRALAWFHVCVASGDELGLGSGSAAFVDALFAPVRAATSPEDLRASLSAPEPAWTPPIERDVRRPLPRLPVPESRVADAMAMAAAIDPAVFAWPARVLARLPSTARAVTAEHRSAGMPPGAIFWDVPDAQGWVVLARPELEAIEAARGRAFARCSHVEGDLSSPTDGLRGSSVARFDSFPGTFRDRRPVRLTLDGVAVTVDVWAAPVDAAAQPESALASLGIAMFRGPTPPP